MAHAKITLHFGISSSSHFWHILKIKTLEIACYYNAFCSLKYTKPNLNLSAENVTLFLREPLPSAFAGMIIFRYLIAGVIPPSQ